ncbi:MAG: sulfotransferase [Betaproteobacteria bacterium]|nr:sulfotransferase [Betaproteobacteria bacterium]
MRQSRPILVTGSHRSGTTWVGRMLAAAPRVAYIHEPFNPELEHGSCRARFDHWFTYVCDENEGEYYRALSDTVRHRYRLGAGLGMARRPADVGRQFKTYVSCVGRRLAGATPLLKDPIALFSAPWLHARFAADPVVMIRHPAAFAASLKVKNWTHPFSHFLSQPLLMRDVLGPFEKEIVEFSETQKDIIDQAALLWKLIHWMILEYRRMHPEWIYVRHEDLSRDPMGGFRSLFDRLGLEFSAKAAQVIREHSLRPSRNGARAGRGGTEDLVRDSVQNIETWKKRLTGAEIGRLRSQVSEVSREFYSEEEW